MKVLISSITDSGVFRVRKELICILLQEGHDVVVVAPESGMSKPIIDLGCTFVPIKVDAHGLNPLKDARVIWDYWKTLKKVRPDVVLTFTIKPNLYCGFICHIMKIPQVMNITGFGTLAYPGIKQGILVNMYRVVAKKVKLIFFQNQSNLRQFRDWHIASESQYHLLPGSGVNLSQFVATPYPSDNKGVHFLFISRILKEKGIDNYLEAAKIIKGRHSETYFHILGNAENGYESLIEKGVKEGDVIYHGRVSNVVDFHRMSHCTILPSYYPEGICNVLLEAAASGRPVITTDHPGCRETVENGETGYLVRPNDTKDLVEKIEMFLKLTNDERALMGQKGRRKMEREFDRQIVVDAYMEVVKENLR